MNNLFPRNAMLANFDLGSIMSISTQSTDIVHSSSKTKFEFDCLQHVSSNSGRSNAKIFVYMHNFIIEVRIKAA